VAKVKKNTGAPEDPLVLNNEYLPFLFKSTDKGAIRSQKVHFAFTWIELVFVSLAAVAEFVGRQYTSAIADLLHISGGISVVGINVSAHDFRNWLASNIFAAGFMIIAIIAFAARYWFHRAELWRRQRSLAEATKSLAWRFVMHAISRQAYLDEYDKQRQQADKLRLTPPETNDAVITERMEAIHAASPTEQQRVYTMFRLEDQAVWYAGKARKFIRQSRTLQVARVGVYVVGLVLILGGFGTNVFAVITTIAGGLATWLAGRHYDDLSQSYTSMASKLLEYIARAKTVVSEGQSSDEQQDRLATFVKEVESFLDGEHQIWLREIAPKQEVAQAAASQSGD